MLLVLKLLAHDRKEYDRVERYIDFSRWERPEKNVLKVLLSYKEEVDLPDIESILCTRYKDKDVYRRIVRNMSKPLNATMKACVLEQILSTNLANDLTDKLYKFESGEEINIIDEVKKSLSLADVQVVPKDEEAVMDGLFEEITGGLVWSIPVLNDYLRPLRPGDDLIVAARPDMGKTTFLAQVMTGMLCQTDKIGVWFNNESSKNTILKRCIQSSLGVLNSEMREMHAAGVLKEKYYKAMGGVDKILVFDIHGKSEKDIEKILDGLDNVGIVVFDMLDNVRLSTEASGDKSYKTLEKLYIWARELAVIREFVTIKTSQISADGAAVPYPMCSLLKDSKTGKQGATDTIFLIGHNNEDGQEFVRYFSCPKNKLRKEGSKVMRLQMILNADRARYES